MKTSSKIGLALVLVGVLASASVHLTSGNNQQQNTSNDPFAQMDGIFEMQMRQMRQMQHQMDAMFNNFEQNFQTPSLMQTPHLIHSSGILSSGFQDKGDHYELKIRVNDLNNSKVNIISEKGMITITTTLNKKEEKSKGKYGKIISYANSSSTQSFTLPPDADETTIKAEQENNTISITLHKKKGVTKTGKVIPITKKDTNSSK
jgi:HSP20 family molecular chaperone IbpA